MTTRRELRVNDIVLLAPYGDDKDLRCGYICRVNEHIEPRYRGYTVKLWSRVGQAFYTVLKFEYELADTIFVGSLDEVLGS